MLFKGSHPLYIQKCHMYSGPHWSHALQIVRMSKLVRDKHQGLFFLILPDLDQHSYYKRHLFWFIASVFHGEFSDNTAAAANQTTVIKFCGNWKDPYRSFVLLQTPFELNSYYYFSCKVNAKAGCWPRLMLWAMILPRISTSFFSTGRIPGPESVALSVESTVQYMENTLW